MRFPLPAPASQKKPVTGADLKEQARARNRWMAIGMAGFVIAVFVGVMAATVLNKRYLEAQQHAPVRHAAATK